jgi:hypothetical protein
VKPAFLVHDFISQSFILEVPKEQRGTTKANFSLRIRLAFFGVAHIRNISQFKFYAMSWAADMACLVIKDFSAEGRTARFCLAIGLDYWATENTL